MTEFDPVVDFDEDSFLAAHDDGRSLLILTAKAVHAVCLDVIDHLRAAKAANLRREDQH